MIENKFVQARVCFSSNDHCISKVILTRGKETNKRKNLTTHPRIWMQFVKLSNLGNNKTFAQCFKITKKVSFYNFEMKARFSDFMWFWNTVILYKFLNFCAKNGQNGLLKIRKFISFWRWMLQCCKMIFF